MKSIAKMARREMKEYNEQVVETLDDAGCIIANKNIIIDNLQARIAELEEENARLKAESRDACFGLNDYYGSKLAAAQAECEFQRNAHKQAEELMLEQSKQLAAEQLNNKLLRKALNTAADKFHDYAEYHSMKDQTQDNIEKVERNLSLAKMCDEALTLPQDTSALEAMIAEAGEVMRERCAELQYTRSCTRHGYDKHDDAAAIRKLGEQ